MPLNVAVQLACSECGTLKVRSRLSEDPTDFIST